MKKELTGLTKIQLEPYVIMALELSPTSKTLVEICKSLINNFGFIPGPKGGWKLESRHMSELLSMVGKTVCLLEVEDKVTKYNTRIGAYKYKLKLANLIEDHKPICPQVREADG